MITQYKLKRAQIGSTMTWMAAFVVIFFIMILFTTATIVVSKAKNSKNEINIENFSVGNYKVERDLEGLLTSDIMLDNRKMSVSDFLKNSDVWENKNLFVQKMKEQFSYVAECYYVCIGYEDKSLIIHKKDCTNTETGFVSVNDQIIGAGECAKMSVAENRIVMNKAVVIQPGMRVDLFMGVKNE